MLSMIKLLRYHFILSICKGTLQTLIKMNLDYLNQNFLKLLKNPKITIFHINISIKLPLPNVVHSLNKPTQSTIFNFNKVTSEVNIDDLSSDSKCSLRTCSVI